jgi:hypothetical protein
LPVRALVLISKVLVGKVVVWHGPNLIELLLLPLLLGHGGLAPHVPSTASNAKQDDKQALHKQTKQHSKGAGHEVRTGGHVWLQRSGTPPPKKEAKAVPRHNGLLQHFASTIQAANQHKL